LERNRSSHPKASRAARKATTAIGLRPCFNR